MFLVYIIIVLYILHKTYLTIVTPYMMRFVAECIFPKYSNNVLGPVASFPNCLLGHGAALFSQYPVKMTNDLDLVQNI